MLKKLFEFSGITCVEEWVLFAYGRFSCPAFLRSYLLALCFALEDPLNWWHSGFSADVSVGTESGDRKGFERIAATLIRPPVSLKRLTYVSGSSTVVYKGRYNPSTKSNFTVLDPKEFLCLLLSHVPGGKFLCAEKVVTGCHIRDQY